MMTRESFEKRFHPNRHDFRIIAVMSLEDDEDHDVTLLDVSKHGMKLQTPIALEVGAPVTIYLMADAWPGIVHWSENGFAGLHLLKPFDLRAVLTTQLIEDDFDDTP